MTIDRDEPMPGWKWCPTCGGAIPEGDPLRPDPRIAKLEALCDDLETPGTSFGAAKRLRAILRGDA